MSITTVLKTLLIAALLAYGAAQAADPAIQVVRDQGAPVAKFKVGDARCVLKDDQIRCTPVSK
jgi:hypothetical protein